MGERRLEVLMTVSEETGKATYLGPLFASWLCETCSVMSSRVLQTPEWDEAWLAELLHPAGDES